MTIHLGRQTSIALLVAIGLAQPLLAAETTKSALHLAASSPASPVQSDGSFSNPLFPNGADPWLEYFDGNYYLTTTTWTSELVMRKSPTLAGLATATPINVWSLVFQRAPRSKPT